MTWVKSINKSKLHPGLVEVIELTLKKLKASGAPFKVYSGLRTFKAQDKLYAKGRTTGGEVVTNARGGQSMHNYGLAVDLAPLDLMTADPSDVWWPDPDRHSDIWAFLDRDLLEAAEDVDDDIEYEWGGRWRFRDVPHVQVRTSFRELSSGYYPHCSDIEWLVKAHVTFLYDTFWMKKRVQYLLSDLKYDVGTIDGIYGSRTKGALGQFTIDNNITLSGRIDAKHIVEKLVREHDDFI